MAVGLTGGGAVAKEKVVKADDESVVGSEVDCETFTTLVDGTGECLLSYGDSRSSGGHTHRVEGKMWLLHSGTSERFTHASTELAGNAECNKTLRCAGGATYPIVGTRSLYICLQYGGESAVTVHLLEVKHVPGLSYHLMPL